MAAGDGVASFSGGGGGWVARPRSVEIFTTLEARTRKQGLGPRQVAL